jgi:predicted kinase
VKEFSDLGLCQQNPKWHAEGDALKHTKKCVKAGYRLLLEDKYATLDPRTAIAAVLFHDIGKTTTTEFKNGAWHAYGHEFESERIARRMLWDEPLEFRELICSCARNHMRVLNMAQHPKNLVPTMLSMSESPWFYWRYQIFVKECDILGSEPEDTKETERDLALMDNLFEIAYAIGIIDCRLPLSEWAKSMIYNKNLCEQEVHVLIGLPGAGKNTFLERILKDSESKSIAVSRDDIRAELGFCAEGDKVVLPPDKEDIVTKEFNERVKRAIAEGKNVYLNNINLKRKYRDAFKALLNGKGVKWVYDYVQAPSLKDNLERRPTFTEEQMVGLINKFDWPQADEYDEFNAYIMG